LDYGQKVGTEPQRISSAGVPWGQIKVETPKKAKEVAKTGSGQNCLSKVGGRKAI